MNELEKYNYHFTEEQIKFFRETYKYGCKTKDDYIKRIEKALWQFESSSQLYENLFYMAMYFLDRLSKKNIISFAIFTPSQLDVIIDFLKDYRNGGYEAHIWHLIQEGIFPDEKESKVLN